jgi:hypothetical protein
MAASSPGDGVRYPVAINRLCSSCTSLAPLLLSGMLPDDQTWIAVVPINVGEDEETTVLFMTDENGEVQAGHEET